MKAIKTIGIFMFFFLCISFVGFFLLYAILTCIGNFKEVTSELWRWCDVGLLCLSAVISILVINNLGKICESKFRFWIRNNLSKLSISYLIIVFTLISIKSTPIWSTEEVYSVLSIQWTIFGLSLTIFFSMDGLHC